MRKKRRHDLVTGTLKKKIKELREKKQIPEKVWQSIKRAGGVEGTYEPPPREEEE